MTTGKTSQAQRRMKHRSLQKEDRCHVASSCHTRRSPYLRLRGLEMGFHMCVYIYVCINK